ncbi:hypothetical protein TGAMA5MH_05068 [Trichoderma gamsii]|uniref:Uncharacterized protein n=1 Tax=Trichoderma gamsii TaxID=398673 RepID=A0A2K0TC74_9HYPO|nr:hypothetical protein TGAMA5MH_05068 [Trichoderma gamsii]
MASAPPKYTPSDAPPSYEDVVKRLNELIGDNPTATTALDAAKDLSDIDVEVLVREHEHHYPFTTEEEKKAFAVNLCHCSSSTEGVFYLEEASKAASGIAREIALTISSLDRKLAVIDLTHGSDFRPKILEIQNVTSPFSFVFILPYSPLLILCESIF